MIGEAEITAREENRKQMKELQKRRAALELRTNQIRREVWDKLGQNEEAILAEQQRQGVLAEFEDVIAQIKALAKGGY